MERIGELLIESFYLKNFELESFSIGEFFNWRFFEELLMESFLIGELLIDSFQLKNFEVFNRVSKGRRNLYREFTLL